MKSQLHLLIEDLQFVFGKHVDVTASQWLAATQTIAEAYFSVDELLEACNAGPDSYVHDPKLKRTERTRN